MSSDEACPSGNKRPKLDEGKDQTNKSQDGEGETKNDVASSTSGSAVTTAGITTIVENVLLSSGGETAENIKQIRKSWEHGKTYTDELLNIQQKPFRHGELKEFIKNDDFVRDFVKLFSKVEFHEKASDLFQFSQSDDLNSIVDPHVYAVNEYLSGKVLPFLKEITGLPLNQTLDMFLSIYTKTDFLLCHDDELESRRIAFIWYLSDEWAEEYGGTLDLYSATDDLHPDKIVQKIVPEYNKFVFFEVGATSFHQVSEVLKADKSRYALSGWFYGDPVPRPTIKFAQDTSFPVLESVQIHEGILKKFYADMYLNDEIYSEINEQLAEESEVLVPGLLRDEVYASICKAIVDMDVSKSGFEHRGPPNISNYEEAIVGPPPVNQSTEISTSEPGIYSLRKLFYSKEFLSFMEKITEFPFTTCPISKVVSSLQKYSNGCYSLLKTGGAKQTGVAKGSSDKDVKEEEEEPNLVDVMFYFANKWNEGYGGLLIYSTLDGEQLITVPPEGNCLAVVVRSPTVNSYTNYVNCLAKDDVFFVYKMTFAFDGNI